MSWTQADGGGSYGAANQAAGDTGEIVGEDDMSRMTNAFSAVLVLVGLTDSSAWPLAWRRADMDFNRRCDLADVPLFVQALLNGCPLP